MDNRTKPPYNQIQAPVAGSTSINMTNAIPNSMTMRGHTVMVLLRIPHLLEIATMTLLPQTTTANLLIILII